MGVIGESGCGKSTLARVLLGLTDATEGSVTCLGTPISTRMPREMRKHVQMVFQEGRRHMSMYNTPYGTMSIGVNTRHLTAQVGESGGDIEIDYAIEIDHTVAGRNVFQIKIKEAAPGCSLKQ